MGNRIVVIDNRIVIEGREFVVKSLHGDGSVLSNVAPLADCRPTALVFYAHERRGVAGPVRARFGVECFVCPDVADDPGALVGESCEGQSFPDFQNFFAVYFVA